LCDFLGAEGLADSEELNGANDSGGDHPGAFGGGVAVPAQVGFDVVFMECLA